MGVGAREEIGGDLENGEKNTSMTERAYNARPGVILQGRTAVFGECPYEGEGGNVGTIVSNCQMCHRKKSDPSGGKLLKNAEI